MPVLCLSESEKDDLYSLYLVQGYSKNQLASLFEVSLRTVGRVIDEKSQTITAFTPTPIDFEDDDFDDGFDDNWYDCIEEDDEYFYPEEYEEVEYHFVATLGAITISKIVDGAYAGQVNADEDHPRFKEASELVWNSKGSQESLEEAYDLLDQKSFIEKASFGKVTVDPEANRVYVTEGDHEIDFHGRLVPRLIQALDDPEDEALDGLINFTTRLVDNPSYRAVNELYDFLEASDIKINDKGMVECFKKVRDNYTDIHSGRFDNSPGKTCSIPRNMVDEDSDRTCSYGLHVCSKSYLPHFGGFGSNRILKVLVDPADFVAVPNDYNNAKARVSQYTVIKDVTEELEGF